MARCVWEDGPPTRRFPPARLAFLFVTLWWGCNDPSGTGPDVPDGGTTPPDARIDGSEAIAPFKGSAASADPLPPKDFPMHPGLAPSGALHVDLHHSGVTDADAPLGRDPDVRFRRYGTLSLCGVLLWDDEGRLYGVCSRVEEGEVVIDVAHIDRMTLEQGATYELLRLPLSEASNVNELVRLGALVVDDRGRVPLVGPDNTLRFVALGPDAPSFEVDRSFDEGRHVPDGRRIDTVLPAHDGRLWIVSSGSFNDAGAVADPVVVGCFDPASETGVTRRLDGEVVENNPAVGADGLFLLTDRALYRFRCGDGSDSLEQMWRLEYPRPDPPRDDTLSAGSGSAPTLLSSGLVAFTDNATPRIHVRIHRRSDGSAVCDLPLFEAGESANENTLVGYGDSLIAQNWAGAPGMFGDFRRMKPGLVRIDVDPDRNECELVWSNDAVRTPNTVRVSTASGLVYAIVQDTSVTRTEAWYLATVDFRTGTTVNETLLGLGQDFAQLYNPPTIGPEGSLFLGVRTGLVSVRDR